MRFATGQDASVDVGMGGAAAGCHQGMQLRPLVGRERELAEGHQEVRFAGYVTVSARDDDELEAACEQVEQAAHQAYLDIQPLWGQQDTGFTQGALPIGRGLRPSSPLGGA